LANRGVDTRSPQHYLGRKNIQHTVRYPISLSAKPFCQGEPEAMGLSRARNRRVTAAP
jgi:hypothetical protein